MSELNLNNYSDTHTINDHVFALRKKSKWTWEAVNRNEETIATDKSRPKLKAKLDLMYTPVKLDINSKPIISKAEQTPVMEAEYKKENEIHGDIYEEVANTIKKKTRKERKAKRVARKSKDTNKNRVSKKNKPESMRSATLRMIKDGADDQTILDYIQANFSNVKYNMTHVKWYRSNFAKSGLVEANFAPRGSEMYKEWAAES